MPKLQEDAAARAMDSVGHLPPALDLGVGVDARRPRIAHAFRRHLRRLGDDQPGGGALLIVLCVKRGRNIAGAGAVARHRRHDDPVREQERAELERRKEV
jgi:hypothetical protein